MPRPPRDYPTYTTVDRPVKLRRGKNSGGFHKSHITRCRRCDKRFLARDRDPQLYCGSCRLSSVSSTLHPNDFPILEAPMDDAITIADARGDDTSPRHKPGSVYRRLLEAQRLNDRLVKLLVDLSLDRGCCSYCDHTDELEAQCDTPS